jgi:hypothetical protein
MSRYYHVVEAEQVDISGAGVLRRHTEQQHDVPSAIWPGRECRPDQGLGCGWMAIGSESTGSLLFRPCSVSQTGWDGGHDRRHGLQDSASATRTAAPWWPPRTPTGRCTN